MQIEYPDANTTTLADVERALPPLTLENPDPQEIWELKLEDAVKMALANAKVMRSLGGRYATSAATQRPQVGEAPDAIMTAPDNSRGVYDPALTETTPVTGVEAALAAFDTQLTSNLNWQHNHHPNNVRTNGIYALINRAFYHEDNNTFNTQLTKMTATGGQFSLAQNMFYDYLNTPSLAVPSTWNVNYQLSMNQPLLAGSGVQFNRIAGPFNPFAGIISSNGSTIGTTTFDGVMLARINTDISLADFEAGVRNLVSDTENAYWELYFAYRALEAGKVGRTSALQTWKRIDALYRAGARGGEAEKEAQSRAQYFQFRAQVQTALNDLFRAENRLRYTIGLAATDGRLIRPADEPTTAKVNFEWRDVHCEALARSPELRRQKWRIKERELEIIAAKNLLLPRLDAGGYYRMMGLGDQLYNNADPSINNGIAGTSALGVLGTGQFAEWQYGFNFAMPLGFRREMSQVRHYEMQLAKERARLQDEELEVSHQLADAIRMLEYNYTLAQTNFNRRYATERQVDAVQVAFEAQTVTLDLLLNAQQARADAEIAYYRTLVDYVRGIIQVHYRKGSLLEYNNVYLAEGPWPAKAQFDAYRLARQRDASIFLNYGFSRPKVISRGAYKQFAKGPSDEREEGELTAPAIETPEGITPEQVPPGAAPGPEGTLPEPGAPATPTTPAPGAGGDRQAEGGPSLEPGTQASNDPAAGGFAWGSLGLGSPSSAGSQAGYASRTGTSRGFAGTFVGPPIENPSSPAVSNEPVEDQPPDSTDRPAASR